MGGYITPLRINLIIDKDHLIITGSFVDLLFSIKMY